MSDTNFPLKIQGRRYTYGEIAKDENLFQWVQDQNWIYDSIKNKLYRVRKEYEDRIAEQKACRLEEARLAAERIAKERKAEEERIAKERKVEEERKAKERKAEEERIAKERKVEEDLYQKIISTPGPEYVAYVEKSGAWYYVGGKYSGSPTSGLYTIYNGPHIYKVIDGIGELIKFGEDYYYIYTRRALIESLAGSRGTLNTENLLKEIARQLGLDFNIDGEQFSQIIAAYLRIKRGNRRMPAAEKIDLIRPGTIRGWITLPYREEDDGKQIIFIIQEKLCIFVPYIEVSQRFAMASFYKFKDITTSVEEWLELIKGTWDDPHAEHGRDLFYCLTDNEKSTKIRKITGHIQRYTSRQMDQILEVLNAMKSNDVESAMNAIQNADCNRYREGVAARAKTGVQRQDSDNPRPRRRRRRIELPPPPLDSDDDGDNSSSDEDVSYKLSKMKF